jgi:ubiquinone/menaquinone biosynthesis C-methylase UbiE
MHGVRRVAVVAAGAAVGAGLWWRRNPSPCPYGQRFWIEAPRPLITRDRLLEALAPTPGERILELGPGTGYYSLWVARRLRPDGTLDILDIQQEMLEHTLRRAGEEGLENLRATRGDAQELPYPDASFDAAFLVTVLGEVPDPARALLELRRVIRPEGRLVVGELLGDPHMVTLRALERLSRRTGFRLEKRVGPVVGYFARLRAG